MRRTWQRRLLRSTEFRSVCNNELPGPGGQKTPGNDSGGISGREFTAVKQNGTDTFYGVPGGGNMIKTISPQDMQEMEHAFLDGTGYPSILLMEHASEAVVSALADRVPKGASVLFVCGSGNNGGDGCAAARLWIQRGGQAEVWLLKSPSQMKGDAGINALLLSACGARMRIVYGDVPEIPEGVAGIVDALFGTGLARPLDGTALEIVERINGSGLPVISVDIPSGVDGATGKAAGGAVQATETVTFHRAKHGHFLYPGREFTGKLKIVDIGILSEWDGAEGIDILEKEDASALLPERPRNSHKGTFGHVLVVAGSEGMSGAAVLCTRAALRAGAGLVTTACTFPSLSVLQTGAPCAMAKVVSDIDHIEAASEGALRELMEGKTALAIGPGLGRNEDTWTAILPLIESDLPKVIDADALYLLARHGGKVGRNTVLTPHAGEMARLCGTDTQAVLNSPVETAQQLASEMNCCVLLKGATTVIAQGEELAMNITGSEAMATGGSGDVLTGMIAGLLAQGCPPSDAARLGAYFHGLAGETAADDMGSRAVTAMDICERIRIE